MSKTNEKFKKLSLFLCFILIFDFLVLNFGIKSKEVKAAPIDISSARVINYDLAKVSSNYLVFDFSNYLSEGEKIENFVLKKGNTKINTQPVDNNKKSWKSRVVLINGDKCSIEATAFIGGKTQKLFYQFVYNNYELNNRPVLNFKGNDLEIVFSQNWLNLFATEGEEVEIRLYTTGRTILNERVKINDIRNNSNKKTWSNKKSEFSGGESGYYLDLIIGGRVYRNKVFNYGNDKTLGIMSLELKSAEFKDDGKVQVELLIKDNDIKLKEGDILRRISGNKYQLDLNKKIGTCLDSIGINSDVTMRLDQINGKKYEGIFDFCLIRMIEKLNFSTNIPNLENNSINIDLKGMHNFLSKTDSSKNKLYIYELNNFSKGTKFGEKLSGVGAGVNSIDIGNKSFDKTKVYLVELTNGTYTISTPFVYTPMNITTTELKETSVKIGWEYPIGYTPVSEDKVEIFLKDRDNSSYSSIPNKVLIHGSKDINLINTTSTVVNGLATGTNYETKIVLKNQNGSIVSYGKFATKPFVLTKPIEIKDVEYTTDLYKNAHSRSRRVTIEWQTNVDNIEFRDDDKVEIFIKPIGSNNFSGYPTEEKYGNPVFSKLNSQQSLNEIKSADIEIPDWMTRFHVDLIYTIGGKKILTASKDGYGEAKLNRRTVKAMVNVPKLYIENITQTSAKIKWDYDKNGPTGPKGYKPENGHVIEINLKKINSLNDRTNGGFDINNRKVWLEHGIDGVNLENMKELELNDLEVGQCYRVRIRHIVQKPKEGQDHPWHFVEEFYNFKTEDFSIVGLKAEQIIEDSRKVKLTWGTNGTPDFGDYDESASIRVFLKEGNTSEYPKEKLKVDIQDYNVSENGEDGQIKPTKQCTIDLPKYNTQYNVKVEYLLKGKKVEAYAMTEAIGEIGVELGDIADDKVTVKCILPKGYQKKETDKVKLTITKQNEVLKTLPINKELIINSNSAIDTIDSGLESNGVYNVTVFFVNDGTNVNSKTTSFKATSNLQLMGLIASNVKSKTATINWDYSPLSKEIKNNSKVEIFIKENSTKKANDDLRTYKKIYTFTQNSETVREGNISYGVEVLSDEQHSEHQSEEGDMKTFKSLDLTKLRVNKEYSVKIKYTLDSDGVRSADETAEAEVSFKTIADTFKATVFTSNQTTASYGWEYPPGYDIQQGDKVEIFIKDVTDDGSKAQKQDIWTGVEAALTLTHEGDINLNDIKAVDVSGLTPERKYKSKIEFTMGTGDDSTIISTEVDISTKSFSIKSFTVDSYEEYDILVKWEIEPENMIFSPADKLEIFVKVAEGEDGKNDGELTQKPYGYPEQPSYKLTMDPNGEEKTVANTFSDYVLAESLGVKQKMLLVYTVGGKEYYKELEFINTINPIKAEVTSVNETRALISVTAPDNYEFVTGDRLLVYAKDEFVGDAEIESEDFLVFEGVQSETLSIPDDMKMIELSYLLPEAKYEILVALDLEDGTVEPAKLELTTTALPVSDIKLESLKHDSAIISWNYGENEIDFFKDENSYDFTDKLIIAHKEADGTAIPDDITAIKKLSHVEYLGEDIRGVKDATIKVEDTSKDYDVAVCYDLGGLLYKKNFKASYLSVKIDEESLTDKGVKINWKYPSNITFGDGDKTEVFVRKKDEANYSEAAAFSSTGSGTVSYTFENLEGGTVYIAKVQITKEGLQIDPVEVEFETKSGLAEETVIEEIQEEIVGTEAQVTIPGLENLEVKKDELQVSMGDEAYKDFTVRLTEDGTGVIIEPTIPKKVYKNIEVTIPLEDGTVRKIVIAEFVTQPENVGQDWLSNAYKFALDRFPDEGGYKYWYEERIEKKTMSGEYFLMNLLFGEDEFTNRNLSDQDLIAALYQIVVNREFDQEGLNFWVGIYNENLQNAQGNKKLAQEVLVDRMVHEPEFGKLCERIGIFWTKAQQEAAGVPM